MEPQATSKRWFRARTYGYGWTPTSWQGWVLVLAYIVIVALAMADFATRYEQNTLTTEDVLLYGGIFVAATGLLIGVSIVRGETPRWQWGKKR